MNVPTTTPLEILKKTFGYDGFRGQQEAVINHVLQGKDSLVIMPTGGGKSLCYQIPALVKPGLTLVISPLIALMEDQVRALRHNNIAAACVHSHLSMNERRHILQQIENNDLNLLYISPEKALSTAFMRYIARIPVDLVAIDEAHCVSIWGNDFRPEYAHLHKLRQQLPRTPFMALTATADKTTQTDMVQQLKLQRPQVFLSSFERTNINIQVMPGVQRMDKIIRFIDAHPGQAGIIYCLSRKSTEQVAERLCHEGYRAAHFHAQLTATAKKQIQDDFQRDELQIICATIAFGMGIDKSNIRWIIHYNLPKNIESYYQEIGRAGRDGSQADALLLHSFRDIGVFRNFIEESDAGEKFKEVQFLKLDRLWDFVNTTHCRTNFILHYFGEHRQEPCGHCDICKHPPQGFDGTDLAIKALQVCHESCEKLTLANLADVLRGSGRKELGEAGWDQLQGFGAGRDTPRSDWMHYLTQLVNQGFLEIDYTKYSQLKLTSLSPAVLAKEQKVKLTRRRSWDDAPEHAPLLPAAAPGDGLLLEKLKQLRISMARESGVPAYVVFPDKVLEAMVLNKPNNLESMATISGIGQFKLKKYGQEFLDCIQSWLSDNRQAHADQDTFQETLGLWRQGHTPEYIASLRQLPPKTIYQHLAVLYEQGELMNIGKLLEPIERERIWLAWRATGHSDRIQVLYNHLNRSIPQHKIRLGLALIRMDEN
jgi:ATP-dependent DNA helicase RecQ